MFPASLTNIATTFTFLSALAAAACSGSSGTDGTSSSDNLSECSRDAAKGVFFCPGDRVYAPSPSDAKGIVDVTVAAVSATSGNISVSDENHKTWDVSKQTVAVKYGCVHEMCVGDATIGGANYPDAGSVVAVYPYAGDVLAEGHWTGQDWTGVFRFKIADLEYGYGCLSKSGNSLCVGDTVTYPDGVATKVVALNPFAGAIATETTDKFGQKAVTLSGGKDWALTTPNPQYSEAAWRNKPDLAAPKDGEAAFQVDVPSIDARIKAGFAAWQSGSR